MESPRQAQGLNNLDISPSVPRNAKLHRRMQALGAQVTDFILAHRCRALAGLTLGILGLGVLDHLLASRYGEPAHLVFGVLAFVLVLLPILWVLASLLENAERQRVSDGQARELGYAFDQKMGNARDWEELTRLVVEYAHQVAPQATATLLVADPETLEMRVEAICGPGEQASLHPGAPQGQPAASTSYDLPVMRNDQPTGLIRLSYPQGSGPIPAELNALKNAAPVIALALDGMRMQAQAARQAAESERQRQQIAQTLHDTLAQNISYLRLKLDQLTGEDALPEIGAVRQELERMRASADEAYQQVRETLDELNPVDAGELAASLLKQARSICQRSGLALHSDQIGVPFTLPLAARQQIIFIAREALHNIEKHACAHQVNLQTLWLESELILKITDDGAGFDPLAPVAEGHYGLWIMQHRAEELGGALKIRSLDASEEGATGTEVTLWVPRPPAVPAQPESATQPHGPSHPTP